MMTLQRQNEAPMRATKFETYINLKTAKAAQRSEIWDRWQAGEPMSSIGRRFDRESSSVFSVISPTGGIRPPARRRARQALSLFEREEISRGLSMQRSLRLIARQLGRSASTISREVSRMVDWIGIGLPGRIKLPGIGRCVPLCKLACRPFLSRTVSIKLRCKIPGTRDLRRSHAAS
jgi:Helix-turn-helix domain